MPTDTRTLSAAEVERWKARGGVDLSRIEDPAERHVVATDLSVGVHETGRRFRFRCGMCGNVATNDQEMEPMCTGPYWTDDHPPEVMALIR